MYKPNYNKTKSDINEIPIMNKPTYNENGIVEVHTHKTEESLSKIPSVTIHDIENYLKSNDPNTYFSDMDKYSEIYPLLHSLGKYIPCSPNASIPESRIVIIADFLNLSRKSIANRADGKFITIKDFERAIKTVAEQIVKMGKPYQICLVTKSFRFDEDVSYNDTIRIILWYFCKFIPEDWIGITNLVLANGINDKDNVSDDVALLILAAEYRIALNLIPIILTEDRLKDIGFHYLRSVTLNFYSMQQMGSTLDDSVIVSRYKGEFRQNMWMNTVPYVLYHPLSKKIDVITVEDIIN